MEKETQLQLVSFEQAKRLKEAGFDWECDNFFLNDGGFCSNNPNGNWGYLNHNGRCRISAPTVALALEFIYEKYGYFGYVAAAFAGENGLDYTASIFKRDSDCSTTEIQIQEQGKFAYYKHPHDAQSPLLDELLTLIEK